MDIFKNGLIKIAICGKKNVGKNTLSCLLSNYVCDLYGSNYQYTIKAFADPIKEIIMMMFPQANRDCLFGSSNRREEIIPNAMDQNGAPLTYRQALIDIGTLGRKYNPKIWVNAFDRGITNLSDDQKEIKLIICSDLRFIEEFDYLKEHGFFLIKLLRNTGVISTNITETTQDGIGNDRFDFIIDNNESLNNLANQANKIMSIIDKPL